MNSSTSKNLTQKNLILKNLTLNNLTSKILALTSVTLKTVTPENLASKSLTLKNLTSKNLTLNNSTTINLTFELSVPGNVEPTLFYQTLNGIHQVDLNGNRPTNAFQVELGKIQTMDFNHYNGTVCWVGGDEQMDFFIISTFPRRLFEENRKRNNHEHHLLYSGNFNVRYLKNCNIIYSFRG